MRTPFLCSTGLVASLVLSGCFFPEYTFDDGTGGGTTTSTTTTGTGGTSTTTTTTTTTGTGGGGGSTTGTGGGGGTTTSTGGGGGGTGGGPGNEDCTNGTDDDGDTLIDCADPGCSTVTSCVAAVPSGWTGYFAVYEGPAANYTGCPADYPTEAYLGNAGLNAPAATCSTCTCGTPTGSTCNLPDINSGDAPCGSQTFCSGSFTLPVGWNGSCEGMSALPAGQTTCGMNANMTCSSSTGVACNQSVSMNQLTVSGGNCTPSTQSPNVPAATWSTLGVACGDPTQGAGCNGSFKCLAKPAAGFQSGVCVMKAGVNACPAIFTKQHVFYDDFTDTRSCTSCGCGSPTGQTCSATVNVFSNTTVNTCTTQIATLNVSTATGACANLAGNPAIGTHSATISGPSGGTCTATGGAPTGAAAPDAATATTFCCL